MTVTESLIVPDLPSTVVPWRVVALVVVVVVAGVIWTHSAVVSVVVLSCELLYLVVEADGVKTAPKQYQPAVVGVTAADVPVELGGVVAVCRVRLTGVPSLWPVVAEQVLGPLAAVKHS